jgi:DNA polymerase-3 subunit gamma/tau
VSEAEATTLKEQSSGITTDALSRIMEVLADAESRLRDAASKKIFLEIMLLKAIEARNSVSIDSVLKKLQQLKNDGGNNGTASPSPSVSAPARPAISRPAAELGSTASPIIQETPTPKPATSVSPQLPSQPEASQDSSSPTMVLESDTLASDIENLWTQLLDAVGRASPFMKTYLLESHPVALNKTAFTIGFDPEFKDHLGLVDNAKNRTILETKLRELGHSDVSIRFIQAPAPAGRGRRAPEPPPVERRSRETSFQAPQRQTVAAPAIQSATPLGFSKDDFKNDPLIKKALEIFKGTIVEVRA